MAGPFRRIAGNGGLHAMRCTLAALISAALLSGIAAVPAIAQSPQTAVVCDQKAMRTIVTLRYDVFSTSLQRCTFRFFLPGGTQATAWTAAEYFHGGTWFEVVPDEVAARGWDRADVTSYYEQITQHLYWGTSTTPDTEMVEMDLKRGPIYQLKEAVPENNWPAGTYLQETYFQFAPQAPGDYKWRYTWDDSVLWGSLERIGHVRIDPA